MMRNAIGEEIPILCRIGCADNNVSHHCLIIRGCQLLTCHMGLQWLGWKGIFLEVRIYPVDYILKEFRIWQEMGDLWSIDRFVQSQCEEAQAAKGSTSSSQGVACSSLYCKYQTQPLVKHSHHCTMWL